MQGKKYMHACPRTKFLPIKRNSPDIYNCLSEHCNKTTVFSNRYAMCKQSDYTVRIKATLSLELNTHNVIQVVT